MSTETAAIIHSILHRKGGTHVTLDGTKYHFIDDDKGRQVAPVANPDHVERFLQIPEGYKLLRDDAATSAPATPMGAAPAPQTPTEPAKAPQQEQGQQTEPEAPEQAKEPQQPAKPAGDTALDDMDTDQLRAAFEDEVGRKPHPQAKDDTMRAQIKAAREDKAGAA